MTSGAISPAGSSKYGTEGVRSISGGGPGKGGGPVGGNPGGGLLRSGRENCPGGAPNPGGGGPPGAESKHALNIRDRHLRSISLHTY